MDKIQHELLEVTRKLYLNASPALPDFQFRVEHPSFDDRRFILNRDSGDIVFREELFSPVQFTPYVESVFETMPDSLIRELYAQAAYNQDMEDFPLKKLRNDFLSGSEGVKEMRKNLKVNEELRDDFLAGCLESDEFRNTLHQGSDVFHHTTFVIPVAYELDPEWAAKQAFHHTQGDVILWEADEEFQGMPNPTSGSSQVYAFIEAYSDKGSYPLDLCKTYLCCGAMPPLSIFLDAISNAPVFTQRSIVEGELVAPKLSIFWEALLLDVYEEWMKRLEFAQKRFKNLAMGEVKEIRMPEDTELRERREKVETLREHLKNTIGSI